MKAINPSTMKAIPAAVATEVPRQHTVSALHTRVASAAGRLRAPTVPAAAAAEAAGSTAGAGGRLGARVWGVGV
ncbi:hypothetical protein EMIHUDRAFT_225757 [Emiliania huxleyi CCMP1516]|uniref:Uncharacterized protein n=2 Tax=Emiliania huxleyi TaxID=2903 RepID=A0A0D3KNG1_EMIH1|nr:hypothetical protein EMIHUDRAFT_225757 [Emiliania huxleyi CCMP1516]EOD37296.1 hypothetical protein EMIHUDRAFT_225757 [Emiliania huxleyi CCMP1516]|eukprot:XP_005789725.1 hypothetical protein EMIHUDRAFT_225757 [Emiliania huxleyi CCMP1516]